MSEQTASGRAWKTEWEKDHRNSVNRALHFFVGMPLVGVGLFLLLFFLDPRGLLCILAGYVVMFAGHFLFEGNAPTILRDPRGVWGAAVYVVHHVIVRPWRAVVGSPSTPPAPVPTAVAAHQPVDALHHPAP